MNTPINEGGPAFPVADSHHPNGQVQYGANGMTLRDYFAGQALAGFLAAPMGKLPHQDRIHVITRDSYDVADAMLVSRERKGGAA